MMTSFLKIPQRGFLVLTLVFLVCTTITIIVTSILLGSISEMSQNSDSEKSLTAWTAVSACGEYALLQMSTSSATLPGWQFASTSGVSLSVGDESCYIYPVTDGDNGAKLIKASSTVSLFTKKILIEVATNTPELVVNSWEEVADF